MGKFLDAAFRKFKRRDLQPKSEPVKLVERRSGPTIKGRADFGGTICGFDLSNECYSERGEIVLTETNWRKAMDDFISLERFFTQVCDYDKTFPTMLKTSVYDAMTTARLHGSTPTGKTPKYAITVSFDAMEPTREPEDWDAWIDQYATSNAKMRETMSDQLNHDAYSSDNIIGSIHYLQSGAIGKADFHFWQGRICHSVSIRSKQGHLYLSKATRKDAVTDEMATVYQHGRDVRGIGRDLTEAR